MQLGLEALYRIRTEVDIADFVLDEASRSQLHQTRRPREQLLVSGGSGEGDLELGLFICEGALQNLAANDPGHRLGDHNWQDFLLVLEGVSHFVCVVFRAQHGRTVSALELELQAEVDKYVTCLLLGGPDAAASAELRERLFRGFRFHDDLAPDELGRYREANARAAAYAESLEERFVRTHRAAEMLAELRRFYRLGYAEKCDVIAQAA
jgi:hypothetical protein